MALISIVVRLVVWAIELTNGINFNLGIEVITYNLI